MATARTVIEDAHAEIGQLPAEESLTATNGQLGLRVLQRMVAAWAYDGIDIAPATSAWTLDTEIPVDDGHLEAIVANLAVRLAPYYEETRVSPATAAVADKGYRALQAAYASAARRKTGVDLGLLRQPSQIYNIETDV